MRLYNQHACTPSVASNAADKNQPLRPSDQQVSVGTSSAWTMKPLKDTETDKSIGDRQGLDARVSPAIGFLNKHETEHSLAPMHKEYATLHIKKSGTDTTASTTGSTPKAKDIILSSVYLCDTRGSPTSIMESTDQPVFEPFRFDIDVIKSAKGSQQNSQGETLSYESSSTLSSRISNFTTPALGENRNLKIQGNATNLAPSQRLVPFAAFASQRGEAGERHFRRSEGPQTIDVTLPVQSACWGFPLFDDPTNTGTFEDKARQIRTKQWTENNLWTDFGSYNDFKFGESSHAQVANFQSKDGRARRSLRRAPVKLISKAIHRLRGKKHSPEQCDSTGESSTLASKSHFKSRGVNEAFVREVAPKNGHKTSAYFSMPHNTAEKKVQVDDDSSRSAQLKSLDDYHVKLRHRRAGQSVVATVNMRAADQCSPTIGVGFDSNASVHESTAINAQSVIKVSEVLHAPQSGIRSTGEVLSRKARSMTSSEKGKTTDQTFFPGSTVPCFEETPLSTSLSAPRKSKSNAISVSAQMKAPTATGFQINQEKLNVARDLMESRADMVPPFAGKDQASRIKASANKVQLNGFGVDSAETSKAQNLKSLPYFSSQNAIDTPSPAKIIVGKSPRQTTDALSKMLLSRGGQASSRDSSSISENVNYLGSNDLLCKTLESRSGCTQSSGSEILRTAPQTPHRNEILSHLLQNRAKDMPPKSTNDQESASRSIQQGIRQAAIASTKSPPKQLDTQQKTNLLSNMLQKRSAQDVSRPTLARNEAHSDETGDLVLSNDNFIKQLNEKSDYAKYARMLKVGLPLEVVKNAMERDGVVMTNAKTKKEESAPQDPIERFRIHWQTHNNARSNTMWAMISREDHWLDNVELDKDEMVSLFEKTRNQKGTKNRSSAGASEGASAVRVIDPKRANNCGIILARIKLSYREIAVAIDTMDSEALTMEQLNGIAQYLPTKEEACALAKHIADSKSTQAFKVECEKFMAEIMRVKNVEKKLDALLFMKRVPIIIEELKSDARILRRACEEIMNSSSLRKILGLILHLGNTVNAAGVQGKCPASAIQLSSLLKLNQAKAFDKKTTFLEFVAVTLRRNYPSLLDQYRQEMPSLPRAERIQWNESANELESIDDNLTRIRRMALQMALSPSQDELSEDSCGSNLLTKMSPDEEARLLQSTALGRFTLETGLRMEAVNTEIDAAKTVFDQISHYFGEIEDKHTNGVGPNGVAGTSSLSTSTDVSPHQILCHLSKFCIDLDNAVERAIHGEKEKSRELRKCLPKGQQSEKSEEPPRKSVLESRAKAKTGGMKDVLADLRSRGKP